MIAKASDWATEASIVKAMGGLNWNQSRTEASHAGAGGGGGVEPDNSVKEVSKMRKPES